MLTLFKTHGFEGGFFPIQLRTFVGGSGHRAYDEPVQLKLPRQLFIWNGFARNLNWFFVKEDIESVNIRLYPVIYPCLSTQTFREWTTGQAGSGVEVWNYFPNCSYGYVCLGNRQFIDLKQAVDVFWTTAFSFTHTMQQIWPEKINHLPNSVFSYNAAKFDTFDPIKTLSEWLHICGLSVLGISEVDRQIKQAVTAQPKTFELPKLLKRKVVRSKRVIKKTKLKKKASKSRKKLKTVR